MPISIIELTDETGEWEIPANVTHADIFLVGGGGGAGGGGGGGGGYTGTWLDVKLDEVPGYHDGKIPFTVGRGGAGALAGSKANQTANSGGFTRFGNDDTYQVEGGLGGYHANGNDIREGGDGGSGGGAGASTAQATGDGGSDGSDGGQGQRGAGGAGQGTTTRAFGEAQGDLYAGGGAGGALEVNASGGAGGGGDSGDPGQNGEDGKGGGGGGSRNIGSDSLPSARGGHGIILVRWGLLSFHGIILDKDGNPASRTITVLDSTGQCVVTGTSDPITGGYDIAIGSDDPYTLVFDGEPDRNAQVFANVIPGEPPE